MSTDRPITSPPGWYPDPRDDSGRFNRWWDGDEWRGQVVDRLSLPQPPPVGQRYAPERSGLALRHWLILGGAAAVLLILAAATMDGSAFLGLILWALLGALWLSPGIIASKRRHRNAGAIWVVTLLLGWTIIGWIVALAMALSDPGPRR